MVFLHGWGGSVQSFKGLYDHYKNHFKVIAFDFPGFGESDEPKTVWSVGDYSDFLVGFLNQLEIENPIIVAHSFGARVTFKAADRIKYHKLILTGAAGIKPKRKLSYYLKVYSYKTMRKLSQTKLFHGWLGPKVEAYKKRAGSSDYRQASPIMRGVLSKSVNEDLRDYFKYIDAPTLLIWGDMDTATPLENGQLMEEMIKDAGLVVFEGCTHFAYVEQMARFISIIDNFTEGDRLHG